MTPAAPPDLSGAVGRRRQWLPQTLAGRLVAGVVALLLVVVTISGATTYMLLRPFLEQQLDQQLTSFASANADTVRDCNLTRGCVIGTSPTPGAAQLATQREWFAGLLPSGDVLLTVTPPRSPASAAASVVALNLTAAQRLDVVNNLNRVRSVRTTDGFRLHVVGKLTQTDGHQVIVVTGLSSEAIDHTLGRLLIIELAVGAAAVLLAAGLTGWGVRVGLRPLKRVTRTAQEVTAELGPDGAGLQRRVPDADPATEVGQVAVSVNTLLQAVETEFFARVASEERMRQFLADASHELRTPLTSIRGYAELSRLRGAGRPGGDDGMAEPDDSMHRIEVEGTRMSRLVEDLLVLARGDQGTELRREPVDVDQLLSETASAVHSAHPEREFSIVASGGRQVVGDRDQLLRVLLNLATNAAVHTPPTGPIRLEAAGVAIPGGEPAVELRVIDGGPGLPPDEAAHVFERFWRADKARTRAKGGSGLGMAIVAQIVQAHGGTVRFESSPRAGTRVTVLLPLLQQQPAAFGPVDGYSDAAAPLPPPAAHAGRLPTRQN